MITSTNLNITWYLEKMIGLLETSPLENQFQDYIIYPVIESVLNSSEVNDIELIDCHNFAQYNTSSHNRCRYSVLVRAVPDLLLAKDFFYYNRDSGENNAPYEALNTIAAVEVKVPNSREMQIKSGKSLYSNALYKEILPTLFKCGKYILTNVRRWDFFDSSRIDNAHLLNDISEYMNILELCGFDNATDYSTVIVKDKKDKKPKADVLERKWNEAVVFANKYEQIAEIIKREKRPSKGAFNKILNAADSIFEQQIKEYVDASLDSSRSVDIVNNPGFLSVDRHRSPSSYITSVSDIQYDANALNELFTKLNSFIFNTEE